MTTVSATSTPVIVANAFAGPSSTTAAVTMVHRPARRTPDRRRPGPSRRAYTCRRTSGEWGHTCIQVSGTLVVICGVFLFACVAAGYVADLLIFGKSADADDGPGMADGEGHLTD